MSATAEMIKVMQAFEEGKQIESKYKGALYWYPVGSPAWNWESREYRIKPEPQYRPYENTAEMIADFKQRFGASNPDYTMPLIWVGRKFDPYLKHLITTFDYSTVRIWHCEIGFTMDSLFEDYVYLDGTPCGKLVEE